MTPPRRDTQHWRLAPGVLRLRERRLAGGAPFRLVRLGAQADADLTSLLGTAARPATGSRLETLTVTLARYGLLLPPAAEPGPEPAARTESLDAAERGAGAVTVVLPALSSAQVVAAALRTVPARVPVVVVDDGSQPPLAPGLPPRAGLRVVRHEVPRGPAAARNAGARLASTPWIAFLDCDVLPPDGWLATLLARGAGPDTLAVAPRIVSARAPGVAGFLERWAGALDLGAVPADAGPGCPVSYVPSALLLVRRNDFRAAGGFDQELRVGEDVDLVWRLRRTGRVRYEPEVVCRHQPRASAAAVLRRRFEYGTSAAPLSRRHPGVLRHADVSVWSFVPWAAGLILHPMAGAALTAAAVAAAPWGLPQVPPADAFRLAAHGQRQAVMALGRWLVRPMWPVTLAAAVVLPGRRKALLCAVMAGAFSLRRSGPEPGPEPGPGPGQPGRVARMVLASLADDVSYSAGVWSGCWRERTIAPLLIRIRVRSR